MTYVYELATTGTGYITFETSYNFVLHVHTCHRCAMVFKQIALRPCNKSLEKTNKVSVSLTSQTAGNS